MARKTLFSLIALLTIASLLLAACGAAETPTAKPPEVKPTEAKPAEVKGKLEIFSWWTGGGEADGLAQMFKIYSQKYPNVEIVNATVAGGAGSNAKAVLKTRMLGGDPPDSFQVHAGQEIAGWVVADKMEPLDDLYASEGWDKVFPQGLLENLKVQGHYYSVPVNIHRSNVLWYNKKVFADNNLTAPKTFDDFFKVAEALKAKGITPLALGDNGPWAAAHLFEDVLVGVLGPEGYTALWNGANWDDPKVTQALETFKKMLAYVNPDHSALSWDQAAQYVIDGKAGMTIMGDWTDGYFVSKGFTDYGWVPSPGTEGTFVWLSDSFGLPKGAKNRDNAIAWLKVCGSFEGQEAFNPLKGSIPARTDGGKAKYDDYLKSAMKDWASNKVAPSVAHGAAAPEGWVTGYVDAIGVFVTKQDVAATQAALVTACKDAGGCTAAAAPPSTAGGKLEIFSWWTGGGEADGLAQMFKIYSQKYPGVEIINATVAGGAGSNAKAVLKTRMLGGDPPDSFQVHAGQEIAGWVVADKMEPLDDLYASEGWDKVFPQGLLENLKVQGHYYSVPVNIHRSNVLWYNKKVFADNNLTAPKTFDDFFKVAEALKAKGITPLALGDNGPWAAAHLFEDVLVGTLGSDAYNGLWNGSTKWDDTKVTEALNNFKKMLAYVNSDHSALSWDQAAQYVIDGKAGMTIMGDWTDGYFVSKGFTDYGWAPSPGTEGTFVWLSDSFGLPKGAKNRDNALAWLKVCGSFEGQEAFNPLKGSIPARTDGGKAKYDDYLKSAMKDWASNKVSPSLAHGAAAPEGWVTAFVDAIGVFVTKQDVAATQKALVTACQDAGVCQ